MLLITWICYWLYLKIEYWRPIREERCVHICTGCEIHVAEKGGTVTGEHLAS